MAWRNPYYDPSLPHHTPQGFCNLQPERREPGSYRRWQKQRREQRLPRPPATGYAAFASAWCETPDFSGDQDAAWWLGHACVLLRLGGRYILTDPVMSQRCSPLPFAGPRRHTPPPVAIEALPGVDAVLISHNHYDHLDRHSIRRLLRRFPQASYFVPLGLRDWCLRRGARAVYELDWWQQQPLDGMDFTLVPAQHWSARSLWDRNRSLWGGWVVQRADFRFYFAGDTAYAEHLAEIGRLGPFDLAAIPIGAYAPRQFMRHNHIDPQQAVRLHCELGCHRSLPIHWGVFELTDESLDEPPRELARSLTAAGLPAAAFAPVRIGGRIELAAASTRSQSRDDLQMIREK